MKLLSKTNACLNLSVRLLKLHIVFWTMQFLFHLPHAQSNPGYHSKGIDFNYKEEWCFNVEMKNADNGQSVFFKWSKLPCVQVLK